MRLLISSYSLEPFPLEEIFVLAQELKADGLELVLTPLVFKTGFDAIKSLSQKYELPIYSLHQSPWQILFMGKWGLKKIVEQANFFGAKNIVVHLASLRRSFKSDFFEWIKNLEKESGVNIAFENAASRILEKWPAYASQPEALEKFIKTRQINMTFDVAKAVLFGTDPYQFFQRCHNYIKAFHFHGFNHPANYHLDFQSHNFDWSGFLSFVKKYNFEGYVTMEIFPLHHWIYFNMPSLSQLAKAKEVIRENFEVLKRV